MNQAAFGPASRGQLHGAGGQDRFIKAESGRKLRRRRRKQGRKRKEGRKASATAWLTPGHLPKGTGVSRDRLHSLLGLVKATFLRGFKLRLG